MKTHFSISVVLPGYNEEENIEETATKCLETLKLSSDHYELVIIDDCSTDRTGEIADQLQAQYDEVKVIHNPINLHVGISVLIGFQAASGDLIVHNAMDYPFDLTYK